MQDCLEKLCEGEHQECPRSAPAPLPSNGTSTTSSLDLSSLSSILKMITLIRNVCPVLALDYLFNLDNLANVSSKAERFTYSSEVISVDRHSI